MLNDSTVLFSVGAAPAHWLLVNIWENKLPIVRAFIFLPKAGVFFVGVTVEKQDVESAQQCSRE